MSTDVLERPAAAGAASGDTAKRRQILDGARTVFLSRGFDGASMGEVARAAGVSKGTLYVYFDSKEALFEALTLEEKRVLAEALFSLDADDPDVAAVLRRLGLSLVEAMIAPDHVASLRMVIGAADKFPRFGAAYYEAGPRNGAERLRAYLDGQVAAGRLGIDDTALAAEQFLSLCSSPSLKRALFLGPDGHCRDGVARNVDGAVRVFLAAYRPGWADAPPRRTIA